MQNLYTEYKGQIGIRLSISLIEKIDQLARDNKTNRSVMIERILSAYTEQAQGKASA